MIPRPRTVTGTRASLASRAPVALPPARNGVIVVDNDVLIRGILRSMLTGVGHDVFAAASGWEALAVASRVKARLILLDLAMPGLNGLLACKRLRSLPDYETTPIIILTAHHGDEARNAAARVGATQFIAKPFTPAALLRELSTYLELDRSVRASLANPPPPIQAADKTATPSRTRGQTALDRFRAKEPV